MKKNIYKKVLVLGSGALKIGQAGEFDYSGSQAIKALKEEGIKTVLINPNIATIQTSENLADRVYFLPVTLDFVTEVIKKERPDGILLAFGGQTALNCGVLLHEKGILKKYNLKVLGTPVESIILTEDREKFAQHLHKIHISTPESRATTTVKEAKKIAQNLGYPVMVRAAFALGGQNSGVAYTEEELVQRAESSLAFSPQILVEKYLHHFKEIEYEVVRDAFNNCVTVCNMENMDPLGIHTGESIVVAPSQTLSNSEYHELRTIAIKIVSSLGVVGECNVQFALNPISRTPDGRLDYYVIEVNARLSRSSALASKATGYPLAYVAAKLALGQHMVDIKNQVTKVTQSFFEPSLDYVIVKIPKWNLEKFPNIDKRLGSSMKSVGEVMGIGRTFEEALQKAIRMLDWGVEGISDYSLLTGEKGNKDYLAYPTRKRIFGIARALEKGERVEMLYKITGIDPWFLHRINNIMQKVKEFKKEKKLTKEVLLSLKKIGVSDKRIGLIIGKKEKDIRTLRKKLGVVPSIFSIDTLGGEFPAQTNYLYMTYGGSHNDVQPLNKKGVMVLGSGPYHIGSSVEFDWTCVNTALALKRHGKKSIIINCNPETVSTDYDISDRLYFEELSLERVLDIYDFEKSMGVIISVGGQKPNSLSRELAQNHVHILGTQAVNIDRAEDRNKFSDLLDTLKIAQPKWDKFTTLKEAEPFLKAIGYPVLIRPSYVLSGRAMKVCYDREDLENYLKEAAVVDRAHPVTISQFFQGVREIECDGVAQNGELKAYAISDHVENAGVHSGDATIVYPPHEVYLRTERRVVDAIKKIVKALQITGPFNIQFLAQEGRIFVIETNVRASRTFPFISKATHVNLAQLLVDALFKKAKKVPVRYPDYTLVKIPQFSFSRLNGVDPILRVEMASTGEAACFGDDIDEAFLKAQLSVGETVPTKGILIALGGIENKVKFLDSALKLQALKIPLFATKRTSEFLKNNGITNTMLYKMHEKIEPNIGTYFQEGKIDLAINISHPTIPSEKDGDYYRLRRTAIDHNIHVITNRQKADLFIKAITNMKFKDLQIKAWDEYK
jgi:carbamoyl-phosphate synthase large subunit